MLDQMPQDILEHVMRYMKAHDIQALRHVVRIKWPLECVHREAREALHILTLAMVNSRHAMFCTMKDCSEIRVSFIWWNANKRGLQNLPYCAHHAHHFLTVPAPFCYVTDSNQICEYCT